MKLIDKVKPEILDALKESKITYSSSITVTIYYKKNIKYDNKSMCDYIRNNTFIFYNRMLFNNQKR